MGRRGDGTFPEHCQATLKQGTEPPKAAARTAISATPNDGMNTCSPNMFVFHSLRTQEESSSPRLRELEGNKANLWSYLNDVFEFSTSVSSVRSHWGVLLNYPVRTSCPTSWLFQYHHPSPWSLCRSWVGGVPMTKRNQPDVHVVCLELLNQEKRAILGGRVRTGPTWCRVWDASLLDRCGGSQLSGFPLFTRSTHFSRSQYWICVTVGWDGMACLLPWLIRTGSSRQHREATFYKTYEDNGTIVVGSAYLRRSFSMCHLFVF